SFLAAASIPNTPFPISLTLRYISSILFFPQIHSIILVKYTSSPFLIQSLPCHKKTFLATCWLMVLAPLILLGFFLLYFIAFSILFQSKPLWSAKIWSSEDMTASLIL